ncbi:hypothetical protein [Methylocella silvestris]|uniref:hypothetical protein n=1 Tax=Methylocella silvestris TaxID=199596 RepID=UPI0015E073A6|nr:hypothetical protein [Methylocella silvestris]
MSAERLTIEDVISRLKISRRTLESWLAEDLRRATDERRFHFHVRHGRRRLWTETSYLALEHAIERESEPGGVLAGSQSKNATATGTSRGPFAPQAVQSAFVAVLDFPLRPGSTTLRGTRSAPSKKTSAPRRQAKAAEVIRLP